PVDLQNHLVLDVGCGNGYYGWKMLHHGAHTVVGFDPFLLYVMQFEVFRRYAREDIRHFVLPLADTDLPKQLHAFDTALSMGVLYHRTSPIDHLMSLWHALRPRGQLVLETLIIDSAKPEVLVPENRYAKMRNVWFIPSLPMLQLWLKRTGFDNVRVVDVSPTTTAEQRQTEWMTFESLPDFLDPLDTTRTIEGDPAPLRAMLVATRR
ncbi:MAG: tRNA 5-methoxyuridine(34)/uridine 5-oxyacetic acid(34) synthase CmoB, partial [Planctomycetaceae bacterium]|nr:tRNA 5-methoxyuridine(34)/uridine 5-oxyacetic acid(34) synthase CmoB [Planctomycetaceae bacterium]